MARRPTVAEVLARARIDRLDGRDRAVVCDCCGTRVRPGQIHGGGYVGGRRLPVHAKRRSTRRSEPDDPLRDALLRAVEGSVPRRTRRRAQQRLDVPLPWEILSLARQPCPPAAPIVLVDKLPEPESAMRELQHGETNADVDPALFAGFWAFDDRLAPEGLVVPLTWDGVRYRRAKDGDEVDAWRDLRRGVTPLAPEGWRWVKSRRWRRAPRYSDVGRLKEVGIETSAWLEGERLRLVPDVARRSTRGRTVEGRLVQHPDGHWEEER